MTLLRLATLWQALLAGAVISAGEPHDVSMERRFLWNEANALMSAAQTVEDFSAAAEAYGRLIDAGVRNGPLFYNLGLARLQAERYSEALAALRRAERYAGSTEDILQNMRLCLRRGDSAAALPWYRFPLFWHFGLPATIRLSVAAAAFSACWLALLMRRTASRRAADALLAASLAVFVLFASSAATTLHQESREALFMVPRQIEMSATGEAEGAPP
jgi:tetratricopeptide (TPR) repeat protein